MMSFNCSTRIKRPDSARRRHGLAPVELVLSIPILLMVMALMVTFGTAACWKIRSETVSRDAAWRSRWPRPNYFEPRPDSWPDSAGMTVSTGDDVEVLNDGAIKLPVVSGPLGPVDVNDRLLDFSRGVQVGRSSIEQRPAMLKTLDTIEFRVGSPIVDNKFQYRQMGLSRNWLRRMPLIYEMPEVPGLVADYQRSVSAIRNSPMQTEWRVLDNDDEFRAYRRGAPDFHPRLGGFCELNIENVELRQVARLLDRIDNVPRNMTRAFIGLYEDLLSREPPISDALRAEIEIKLQQLRDFEDSLDNGGGGGGGSSSIGPNGPGRSASNMDITATAEANS